KMQSPSPWQLVLCGADWNGAETIRDLARHSPFSADIHLPGFVSDAELPTWYRAASVFVYPSLCEGFGMPPLEAMACGCPVIAPTLDAVMEVCGDAADMVDPRDVEAITGALSRLARDENLRTELQATGLVRAKQFDWQRTATATVEVYTET